MKYIFSTLVIMLLTVTLGLARWAFIPLEQLVQESDLIVIGALTDVKEHTENEIEHGRGVITVDKVLWGNVKAGEKLNLTWENAVGIVCPRIDHKDNQQKKAIWLLTVEKNNGVKADYPGRFVELTQKEEILKLIKQNKAVVSKNISLFKL
ncbi:MAG: hypothetical protein FD167_1802 [bacterium]|nr:MAG: hypothetical protein FD167_1802 [bacterium]